VAGVAPPVAVVDLVRPDLGNLGLRSVQ
jgi:hypothetical protein